MKRSLLIIGSGGAGKLALVRRLGEKINIEVYHLDTLFWEPNWQQVPKEKQKLFKRKLSKKNGLSMVIMME